MKNNKPIIAVDCDHVVMDINEGIRLYVNEAYGESHTQEDYQVNGSYRRYWERVWGTPEGVKSDRFAQFIDAGKMAELEEIPDALESLRSLKDRYDIVMLTARSEREVGDTHSWLGRHALGVFDQVIFMHQWQPEQALPTKGEICRGIGAKYLIDDNYDHCQIASNLGVASLLFGDYGWNREVELADGMVRASDWSAVKRYFNEQS